MTHPRVIEAKMLRKLIVTLAAFAVLSLPAHASTGHKATLKLADSRLEEIQQRASRSEVWEVRATAEWPAQVATITPQPSPRIHVVQPGEGLVDIARIYGVDWRRIYDANPSIPDTDYRLWLHRGQEIRVPDPSEEIASRPLPAPPAPPPPRVQSDSAAPAPSGDWVALGRQLSAERFGEQHWDALYSLWSRESGWSPTARNTSSGACGIPQAYPCSKLPGFPGDPEAQIRWGLDYIAGRYGNPSEAWAYFRAHGSY